MKKVMILSGLLLLSVAVPVAATAMPKAVMHSSGQYIRYARGGYVAGTLGTVGTTIISVATSPITIAVVGTVALAVTGYYGYRYFTHE